MSQPEQVVSSQKPVVSKPMFMALCAVSALILIGLGVLVFLWLARPRTQRQEIVVDSPARSTNQTAGKPALPSAPTQTVESMQAIAKRVSGGDSSAMTELEVIAEGLYRGINYQAEQDRVRANLFLMRGAYDQLGADAAAGNKKAMDALKSSLRSRGRLKSFAPDALGIAAAAGNKEAMDLLLDYKKTGVLLSSTVFALRKAADKNDPRAVKFLIDVMNDDKSKPLWSGASDGLKAAAEAGNADAQAAQNKYDQYQADRNSR